MHWVATPSSIAWGMRDLVPSVSWRPRHPVRSRDTSIGVLVIPLWYSGIREELRNFARRIAGQGYYCLLPDMYYRRGRVRIDLTREFSDGMREEMFAHMLSLGIEVNR